MRVLLSTFFKSNIRYDVYNTSILLESVSRRKHDFVEAKHNMHNDRFA